MNNFELDSNHFKCAICGRFLKYDKRVFNTHAYADYYKGWMTYVTHKKCDTKEKQKIKNRENQ